MSTVLTLIHDGACVAGAGMTLYSATITVAALTALLAPTVQRRRDARAVLTILLRRQHTHEDRPI
ncbi:hypothetical protein [Nucisporomicrobium flavum]|uniref:hypothetical protein n=1 Tax=Nucisporomicrobium flavum TaxID=2785915 RepID=UPI0018F30E80|nr:hypothetical protein [Nucisporomicrobium flavum]